jgi:hypothetical protein
MILVTEQTVLVHLFSQKEETILQKLLSVVCNEEKGKHFIK